MAKDTNAIQDFAAGIDPTGVATFNAASKNTANHRRHRALGVAGGFIGGSALGVAIPAAVYAGASIALKKKMPKLSGTFSTASKDTIKALNPFHLYKSVKAVPHATEYLGALSKASKTLESSAGKIIHPKSGDILNAQKAMAAGDKVKNIFKGKGAAEGSNMALTGLLGAAGGLGSGVLNASSAYSQYNAALKKRGLDKNGNPIRS